MIQPRLFTCYKHLSPYHSPPTHTHTTEPLDFTLKVKASQTANEEIKVTNQEWMEPYPHSSCCAHWKGWVDPRVGHASACNRMILHCRESSPRCPPVALPTHLPHLEEWGGGGSGGQPTLQPRDERCATNRQAVHSDCYSRRSSLQWRTIDSLGSTTISFMQTFVQIL
jgi:hypothetical protein